MSPHFTPWHLTAQYSTVEVVKLLFAAHPDAALVDDEHPRRNLLHNGIYNTVDPNMMPYLCHSFPKALQGFSQDRLVLLIGFTSVTCFAFYNTQTPTQPFLRL